MAVSQTTIRSMSDLIEPHLRHIRAAGYAINTIDDRAVVLRRADAELPLGLNEATVEELADWLAGPKPPHDPWSNQTKATYYGHLKGFFDWACNPANPHLDYNPASSLTRPKVQRTVPRPVTDAELADILDRAKDPFRRWVILAAYAGLRAIEISTIERRDFTEETITIRGKGGKNAVLPCHPEVWRVVKDLPAGRIARHSNGGPASATFVSSRFGLYCRSQLRVFDISLHRMRHWFGTTTLAQSHDLRVVQELLRHSSPATTAIYTQITDGQRRSAIAALPVLLAPAST